MEYSDYIKKPTDIVNPFLRYRTRNNFKREEAARRCLLSVDVWNNYEYGRTMPDLETAMRMADEFGIPFTKAAREMILFKRSKDGNITETDIKE